MKSDALVQIEFIKDLLRKGLERKVILQLFAKTYKNKSVKTFDNRLKAARAQMGDEVKAIQAKTDQAVAKEVEARKLKIMTVAERIDILARIADGEIKIPNTKFQWNSETQDFASIEVLELPDHATRIKAIGELNRMDGSYSPDKLEIGGKKLPSWLTDDGKP